MSLKAPRLSASTIAQLASIAAGLLVFGFLLTRSISYQFSAQPEAGAPEAAFRQELNRAMPRALHHFGVPGVVIATVVGGVPTRTYAYGFADLRTRRRMTADTIFRVASISKSLTAWGVLRLVQEGKVDLDRPAEQYLSKWPLGPSPVPADAVTVRRLLNHTAGVSAGGDAFRRPGEPSLSTLDVLHGQGASAPAAALVAPAGKAFLYSAPGYTLLQMLIEDQTHRPFADYMYDAVLRPLGMTSSSFRWNEALRQRTATAYLTLDRAMPLEIPQDAAADSLFTTATDLAKFIGAPLPDKDLPAGANVLNPAVFDSLFGEQSQVRSLQMASLGADQPALGYFIEHSPGRPAIVTNGGFDPGWSSRFYLVPSTGDGLVVLTNSDLGQPVISRAAAIWSSWRGLPPSGMTVAYRTLSVCASVLISLLVMLAVSFASGLGLDVKSGVRRFGAFSSARFMEAAIEGALVISALLIWTVAYPAVRTMPTLYVIGTSAIASLTLAVLARLLFPTAQPSQFKRPAWTARLVFGSVAPPAFGRPAV